jgi:hypothetical protein
MKGQFVEAVPRPARDDNLVCIRESCSGFVRPILTFIPGGGGRLRLAGRSAVLKVSRDQGGDTPHQSDNPHRKGEQPDRDANRMDLEAVLEQNYRDEDAGATQQE